MDETVTDLFLNYASDSLSYLTNHLRIFCNM